MGAGLLSLPRAFSCTGAGMGVVLLLLTGWAADFSLQFLVICSRASRRNSFESCALHFLGPWGRRSVNVFLLLLLFLGAVVMLTIFKALLTTFIHQQISSDAWYGNSVFIAMVCLACTFPFCIMDKITVLKYTSALALSCLTYYYSCLVSRSLLRHGGPQIHDSVIFINYKQPMKIFEGW